MDYPQPTGAFDEIRLESRCADVRLDRRCQLLAGHAPDHAYAPKGGGPCVRWNDEREWVDAGDQFGSYTSERLPWSMFRFD